MSTFTHDVPHDRPSPRGWPVDAAPPDLSSSVWDYAETSDALLVVFARKINDRHAVEELTQRHHPWLRHLIGHRARRAGLGREDTEDAQQEGIFALLQGLVDYDLLEAARPKGCSFRTFVTQRALSHFWNSARRLRWLREHQRGEFELLAAVEGQTHRLGANPGGPGWCQLEARDPALAAQWRELYALLREAIARFNEEEQRLLEQSAESVPLETMAQATGVSPRTIQRRTDRLYGKLRDELKDYLP
jgi:RNA polymerase sigma factor (sigma-70 family)